MSLKATPTYPEVALAFCRKYNECACCNSAADHIIKDSFAGYFSERCYGRYT